MIQLFAPLVTPFQSDESIDETARQGIADHIATARAEGRLLHALPTPQTGTYIAPTLISVNCI